MDSVRSFLGFWALLTALIIGYAVVDLRTHPELREEDTFSMEPDLSKIGSLPHWGGRLLKERAVGLLVGNAVALGGVISLSSGFVVARIKRRGSAKKPERKVSTIPPPRFSTPPPAG